MKQIIPEIYINNCKLALPFYRELFGGEIKNVRMSEDLTAFQDLTEKVIHSELHINGRCVLYFIDIFDAKRKSKGNVTVVLHMDGLDELTRCFNALKENGEIAMPPQKTIFGAWHAIVTDRFGAPWALNAI